MSGMNHFGLAQTLGVRVVEVDCLGCDAEWVETRMILLVDSKLTCSQRRDVQNQVLDLLTGLPSLDDLEDAS